MQIEKIKTKEPFPCFRCLGMAATHRVTININDHGILTVCLCEGCLSLPETELYAHFMMKGGKTNEK